MFKAYADYRATEAFSLGVNLIAVGSSYARGNENNLHQPDGVFYLGPGKAGGYGVLNLSAEYRVEPRFTVFGQINNLLRPRVLHRVAARTDRIHRATATSSRGRCPRWPGSFRFSTRRSTRPARRAPSGWGCATSSTPSQR